MATSEPTNDIWIGPSILSADFLRLGEQLQTLEDAGADYIHFDAMDGRYVPNFSIGLPILEAIRRGTSLPVDAHLMMVEPELWLDAFADAGADRITFHAEASIHMHRSVQEIEKKGKVPGVSINPATPVSVLEEIIPYVGQVLIMTVNPGFGGQTFIETSIDKIRRMRDMIDRRNPGCRLQVDGGINPETIRAVVDAGADMIVAGSAVLGNGKHPARNLEDMRHRLK